MKTPSSLNYQAILEGSPNPYMVIDRDWRYVWANRAYLDTTGRELEELVGRPLFEAFPSEPGSESHRILFDSITEAFADNRPSEIALIRYDITNSEGELEQRYWSATHTPLTNEAGEVVQVLQHTVDVTELHDLRRMRDEMGLVARAGAVQAKYHDLSKEAQQLKELFENSPGLIAVLSGPDHRVMMANTLTQDFAGDREMIGRPIAEAVPEVKEQGFLDLLDQVRESGEAYRGKREKMVVDAEDGRGPQDHFFDFVYQPMHDSDGSVTGIFIQGHDVTEEVTAAGRQKLLIDELNHRVKNTLSIVQGLVGQSFRGVEGSEAAQESFSARLHALAAAHTLLTESTWQNAKLRSVLEASIEATSGSDISRVSLEGPDYIVMPQIAVSLAMIIHELGTNAIKYGALSNGEGTITISWNIDRTDNGDMLELEWTERGGPPVVQPERRGFGSRLITHGLVTERDNNVEMRFEPEGLRCTLQALLPGTPG